MAYAVLLPKPTCSETRCTRLATHEVRNRTNERIRLCCQRHADNLVRQLGAEEDRQDAARENQ